MEQRLQSSSKYFLVSKHLNITTAYFQRFITYSICLYYSHPDDRPKYLSKETASFELLTKLLTTLHQHLNSDNVTKKYIKEEDILQEIRTFCADETVSPEVKHQVLQLIEKTVKLTGEDKILLLYHQTQSIVHKHWEIEVGTEDH
jgi:hypothetical protein